MVWGGSSTRLCRARSSYCNPSFWGNVDDFWPGVFRRRRRRRGPRRTAAVFAPPRRRPRQDLRVRAVRVRWKETEARWRAPCPVWRHARKGVLGQLLYVFAMLMVVDRLLARQTRSPSLVPMDGLEHLRTRKFLDFERLHAARETASRHRRRRGCAGSGIVATYRSRCLLLKRRVIRRQ